MDEQLSKRNRLLSDMNRKLEELKNNFSKETVESIQATLPSLADRLTAYNPHKHKSVPSYVEKAIDGVLGTKEPEEDIFIGKPPSEAESLAETFVDRERILLEAKISNSKLDDAVLKRIIDAGCNRSYTVPELKKMAVLDGSEDTMRRIRDLMSNAGITFPKEVHIEAVAAVARGILRYVFTHHKCEYKKSDIKTPFEAWRMRDYINEHIQYSDLIPVNLQGFDNSKQIAEFRDNFKAADIVLWNRDIWETAIRGYHNFQGTLLDKELVESITPMFWQYDSQLLLGKDLDERGMMLRGLEYDCVGFVVLPTTGTFVGVDINKIPATAEKVHKYGREFLRVPDSDPVIQEALERGRNGMHFSQHGINIAIIYISPAEPIPEIRFVDPIFEGDVIDKQLHAIILAGAKFLTLKYVAQDTVGVSKKELKADRELFKKVRKGKVNVPPIKIINLRRAERRYVTPRQANDEKRHLHCHFIRDAHWRKQWYPSEQRHKPIRIEEMVVGDTNLPFKPPRMKVYKAIR